MTNQSQGSNRINKPENIVFEYEENKVVPVFAADEHGQPYTGKAHGSVGAADWDGAYAEGLPHGKFTVLWGGMQGGDVFFERGHKCQ